MATTLARGKMRVQEVVLCDTYHPDEPGDEVIKLCCQYDESDPEDTKFSKATPSGSMELRISNPNLISKFQPGQIYYVDLTPAD